MSGPLSEGQKALMRWKAAELAKNRIKGETRMQANAMLLSDGSIVATERIPAGRLIVVPIGKLGEPKMQYYEVVVLGKMQDGSREELAGVYRFDAKDAEMAKQKAVLRAAKDIRRWLSVSSTQGTLRTEDHVEVLARPFC